MPSISWTDLSLNGDSTPLLVAEAEAQEKLSKSACPPRHPLVPLIAQRSRENVQKNFPSPSKCTADRGKQIAHAM